jgi:hypothetical protein
VSLAAGACLPALAAASSARQAACDRPGRGAHARHHGLLAKDGLVTGLWGIVFVASVAARRPAAFAIARPLMEGRRVFAACSWGAREPGFRRIWRVSSLVWGGALLADAAIRVLLAYALPVDEVPGLGGILWPCTLVIINVVTNLYYQRAGLYRLLGARWLQQP